MSLIYNRRTDMFWNLRTANKGRNERLPDNNNHPLVFPCASSQDASPESRIRKARIALYSHDTMGLGHMRRNLLIAQTLAAAPVSASILMIAGACQIGKFTLPAGVDCVSLPSLCKNPDGEYGSRTLDVSLRELSTLRAKTIHAALESFRPNILIVDNVPRGALGELDQTLESLHGKTRLVLGLRDILDSQNEVHVEWARSGNFNTIRKFYETIWVYADPAVYNLVYEYDFPVDVARKVRFLGYLDQCSRLQSSAPESTQTVAALNIPDGPRLAVCLVGGGQDGVQLAEIFARAELPRDFLGVIVTGPFMSPEMRQRIEVLATANGRLKVIEFLAEPLHLVRRADRLVSMGGYNTSCEALSFGIPWLIVPRTSPRAEQLVRAERLNELGIADFLLPNQLTPKAVTKWLERDSGKRNVGRIVDLNGLTHVSQQAQAMVEAPRYRVPRNGGIQHVSR